jgi:hypothetical protein
MHAANPFKAINSDMNIFGFPHILKGKILANASRSSPEELVRFGQR